MLAASVTFEVVDRNLTDLLIKTTKGSSLSGVVVLEGNERAPAMLSGLRIYACGCRVQKTQLRELHFKRGWSGRNLQYQWRAKWACSPLGFIPPATIRKQL